jgi:8-hydroxy-5-deazaflavin:NADPH oxidoreductase
MTWWMADYRGPAWVYWGRVRLGSGWRPGSTVGATKWLSARATRTRRSWVSGWARTAPALRLARSPAAHGELVVLAVLGNAAEEVIVGAGRENFGGKVVIDAMNPLDFSGGFPPKLSISGEDSLGERVQRALPDAKVVKAFNTIGNPYFVDPAFSEGRPTMLIAGDDEDAKALVRDLLADFGWSDTVDIGGIEGSRELEAICIVWVKIGGARGAWDHGFKLLVG